MFNKRFIVLRCSKCGKWTYARSRQKTRFCSRCEKRFKIDPVQVIYAADHRQAHYLVKMKNEEEMNK